jgi:hypothetical protein
MLMPILFRAASWLSHGHCRPRLFSLKARGIEYDARSFDLIIPTQTPPLTWLQCLNAAIRNSQQLRTSSRQLRNESAAVRSDFRQLCATMRRHLADPIDIDQIWRGDGDKKQ